MQRTNRYFFDQGSLTNSLRESGDDKHIDTCGEMISIHDENAALVETTSCASLIPCIFNLPNLVRAGAKEII